MHTALDNLCGPGKPLKTEAPDANEIAGLLRTGIARLQDVSGALKPKKSGVGKWRRKLATVFGGHLWRRILAAESGVHGAPMDRAP